MSEFHESIAVVWPSSVPVSDPEAHCTMLFLGQIPEVSFTKKDVLRVLANYDFQSPGDFYIRASNLYGTNKDVLVAELHDPKRVLSEQREYLEEGLEEAHGIVSASQFGFSPHVTISPKAVNEAFAPKVTLGSPVLWWGSDRPVR
jgi:2'-5' RNA ligase